MSKQTAVEWLAKHLKLPFNSYTYDLHEKIEQAKQMEKEQIMDAYWDGGQDIALTSKTCEQYYNKTFKQ